MLTIRGRQMPPALPTRCGAAPRFARRPARRCDGGSWAASWRPWLRPARSGHGPDLTVAMLRVRGWSYLASNVGGAGGATVVRSRAARATCAPGRALVEMTAAVVPALSHNG